MAGMRETLNPLSVIGKKNQTFTVFIETSGRHQTRSILHGNEVNCFFRGMRVIQRANISAGLVEHHINERSAIDNGFAVKDDRILIRYAGGRVHANFAIDSYMSGFDEFSGMSAGSSTGICEIFGKINRFHERAWEGRIIERTVRTEIIPVKNRIPVSRGVF